MEQIGPLPQRGKRSEGTFLRLNVRIFQLSSFKCFHKVKKLLFKYMHKNRLSERIIIM